MQSKFRWKTIMPPTATIGTTANFDASKYSEIMVVISASSLNNTFYGSTILPIDKFVVGSRVSIPTAEHTVGVRIQRTNENTITFTEHETDSSCSVFAR